MKDLIEIEKKIRIFIQMIKDKLGLPGIAVGIRYKDKGLKICEGYRNISNQEPVTPDTLMMLGSTSKSVTAMGILKLLEHYEVDLQTPIKDVLPIQYGMEDNPVNIHHLLSHTSGVPEYDTVNIKVAECFPELAPIIPKLNIETKYDHMQYLGDLGIKRVLTPGETFMYNNEGYTILTYLIEELTKKSFPDWMKENLLSPLGMLNSGYDLMQNKNKSREIAKGYMNVEGIMKEFDLPITPSMYGAGGFISSINEFQNYLDMMMQNGFYDGRKVMDKISIEKIWSKNLLEWTRFDHKSFYGYGWLVNSDFCGTRYRYHTGNAGVCSSYMGLLPDEKISVFVMANADMGEFAEDIGQYIFALLLGKEEEIPNLAPRIYYYEIVQSILGDYETANGVSKIKLSLEGDVLLLSMGSFLGEAKYSIYPYKIQKNRWIFATASYYSADSHIVEIRNTSDSKKMFVKINSNIFYRKGSSQDAPNQIDKL